MLSEDRDPSFFPYYILVDKHSTWPMAGAQFILVE